MIETSDYGSGLHSQTETNSVFGAWMARSVEQPPFLYITGRFLNRKKFIPTLPTFSLLLCNSKSIKSGFLQE